MPKGRLGRTKAAAAAAVIVAAAAAASATATSDSSGSSITVGNLMASVTPEDIKVRILELLDGCAHVDSSREEI